MAAVSPALSPINALLQTPRIHFGPRTIETLPAELRALGLVRPLLVSDQGLVRCGIVARVAGLLGAGEYALFDAVPENPTVAGVEATLTAYRANGCDGLLAVGGGSVIDCAKAAAVLARQPGPLTEYLGHGHRVGADVAPLIAVPTTAGTGSEASRGCGIHPSAHSAAMGINTPHIVPKVALCDPDLTLSLPPRLTAGTGLDALSHCIEGFLACSDNPIIDAIALDGIGRVMRWLEAAVTDGSNREARGQMLMAGLEGGIAIGKGLGPAHAVANAFGSEGLHHGMMVAIALPAVLNLQARLASRKLAAIAASMGLGPTESPAEAVAALNRRLGIPSSIRALGYKGRAEEQLVAECIGSPFNLRSPVRPSAEDYRALVAAMLA